MANLLPNAVYHSKAVIKSCTYGDRVSFASYPLHSVPLSDTGVFVRNPSMSSMTNAAFCGMNATRITTPYYYAGAVSGINMDVVSLNNTSDWRKCWSFAISGTGNSETAGIAILYIGCPPFEPNSLLYSRSDAKKVGSIPVDTILSTGSTGSKLSLTVDKTEICYANSSKSKELVYITGVSMLCTMDGNIMDDVSFIIARAIPISGTGFINVEQTGGSTNGSFIFTTNGSVIDCISGDNISSLSSGTISHAIPDYAMVSNDGLAAVSCMASGNGEARWLGYKNGIYKIYQGPTPHYGMPGERVTIKGHEFVCIVYGPFYARLS